MSDRNSLFDVKELVPDDGEGEPEEGLDLTFVDYNPGSKARTARGIPRLAHKKSKTGCKRCRARRVKVCSPRCLRRAQRLLGGMLAFM